MREATKRVVQHLKEVKIQKQLTCQAIVDACEEQGVAISLTTVRRFFAMDSENGPDYRPYTVNALLNAVVGTETIPLTAAEEASFTDAEKEVFTENAALKAAADMHNAVIEDLQNQIAALKQEKSDLEHTISVMQIKLDTTTDMFRLAMESIGKSAMQ
jgi:hypothetical protein